MEDIDWVDEWDTEVVARIIERLLLEPSFFSVDGRLLSIIQTETVT